MLAVKWMTFAQRSPFTQKRDFDFCASLHVRVRSDLDTLIATSDGIRLAMVCKSGDNGGQD